jgi:TolA-binding protein
MTTKTQLQSKIQELEQQLTEFKYQLSNYQELTLETAEPGDVLPDGTVVIQKSNGLALLAAPKETEVHCAWSKEFADAFAELKEHGLNPSQWFIPTKEQLNLAYKVAKEHFASAGYWSSTEVTATSACNQYFNNGGINTVAKSIAFCVRAFRCVTY